MLTSVDITNYRGFKRYCAQGLARVNLFGGMNNSGKTALIESIHFLVSGGDPGVLAGAAIRRGEFAVGTRDEPALLDVSHFFHGHEITIGSQFHLQSKNGFPPVTVEAVALGDLEPTPELFELSRSFRPAFALKISGRHSSSDKKRPFVLSEEGALLVDPRRPSRWYISEDRRTGPPIVFIAPDSIGPESLSFMWHQILKNKQEADVRRAMQILEKNLEDIQFPPGEFSQRFNSARSGVLVGFTGDARRVPLGSMGDGMRRLLALSISLIHAKGGFLFVDEIDTGLHYSVMADLWKLVIETARTNDIQVFATTHSLDCYRGVEAVCQRDPSLLPDVAVHKIDRYLECSVPFQGKEFMRAVAGGIELR